MSRVGTGVGAFGAQVAVVADWLDTLAEPDFAVPSVLDGWDVRTLVGHLVLVQNGLLRLSERVDGPAIPVGDYVTRYRPAVASIAERTQDTTAGHSPAELIAHLRAGTAQVRSAAQDVPDKAIVAGGRGPISAADWVATRLLEIAVHTDDLNRSLPTRAPAGIGRPVLTVAVRLSAEILAAQAPGRSVELRVPPFVAVQAVAGPTHRRGTPPNVVETDGLTWLRLATGRTGFAAEVAAGSVRATGPRSDLSEHLPVLS